MKDKREFSLLPWQKEILAKDLGTGVPILGWLFQMTKLEQEQNGDNSKEVGNSELIDTAEYWVHILSEFIMENSEDKDKSFNCLYESLLEASKRNKDK